MSTKAISVTEAARNFADCVNRARYQGTTFVLHKNGVPVARIVPEERKPRTGRELPLRSEWRSRTFISAKKRPRHGSKTLKNPAKT